MEIFALMTQFCYGRRRWQVHLRYPLALSTWNSGDRDQMSDRAEQKPRLRVLSGLAF